MWSKKCLLFDGISGGGGGQFDDVLEIVQCACSGSFVPSLFDLLYVSISCLFWFLSLPLSYSNDSFILFAVYTNKYDSVLLNSNLSSCWSDFDSTMRCPNCLFLFYILFCTLFFSICTLSPSLPSPLPPMPKPQLSALRRLSLCFSFARLYVFMLFAETTLWKLTLFSKYTHIHKLTTTIHRAISDRQLRKWKTKTTSTATRTTKMANTHSHTETHAHRSRLTCMLY